MSHIVGLEKNLHVCKNCWVILWHNLDLKQGLVNGVLGYVLAFFTYQYNEAFEFIVVQFDHMEQPTKIGHGSARFLLIKYLNIHREQFPFYIAYATTIHKSQALSLDYVLLNIGHTVLKKGMAFIALFHVKTLSGLYIIDFYNTRINADSSCVCEYDHLRRTYNPSRGEYPIVSKPNMFCQKEKEWGKQWP